MHRLSGLLLLIAIASLLASGYRRPADRPVARHAHGLVVDVFGFEAREEVAALGDAECVAPTSNFSFRPTATPAS
jgi:hypothetical protein